MNIFVGMIVDIFGGSSQNWTIFGVISLHFRALLKLRVQNLKIFFFFFFFFWGGGGGKISNIFGGMPDIFGVNSSPGGYSQFFFMHRLGPSIYPSPPKNNRNFTHPQKYLKF